MIKNLLKQFLKPSEFLQNSLKELIVNLISNPIVCFDIGASYYPHPAWSLFRHSSHTLWIAIEPNVENTDYIKNWPFSSKAISINKAVSQDGGLVQFYKTNVDSGSSLLRPSVHQSMKHRIIEEYFFPIEERHIESIKFQDIFLEYTEGKNVLIKLDTQGSELSILQSISQQLSSYSIICVELESTMLAKPLYENNSKFPEVIEFMEGKGFELVHIAPIPAVIPRKGDMGGISVINECDAVFMLRHDIIMQQDIPTKILALVCYISYKIYGEALYLIDYLIAKTDSLSNDQKNKLEQIKRIIIKLSQKSA